MIVRTSWVFGGTGKNFLLTILKLAREREMLRVVGDQHGAPTWSRDLARLTAAVMGRLGVGDLKELGGVYHAAGGGETTWSGFAAEGIRILQAKEPKTKLAKVEAITTAEYPTAARRPANSRLNCDKLGERLGWRTMEWRESLGEVMAEL